jgi:hypothetical protein
MIGAEIAETAETEKELVAEAKDKAKVAEFAEVLGVTETEAEGLGEGVEIIDPEAEKAKTTETEEPTPAELAKEEKNG